MNKLTIAIALCAALAACKQPDTAPPAATAPNDASATPSAPADVAAADAPAAGGPAVPANSGLPEECETYLNRAKACFSKANPAVAAAFQKSLDEARTHWVATTDKATLRAQCVQAGSDFAKTAAALKCE